MCDSLKLSGKSAPSRSSSYARWMQSMKRGSDRTQALYGMPSGPGALSEQLSAIATKASRGSLQSISSGAGTTCCKRRCWATRLQGLTANTVAQWSDSSVVACAVDVAGAPLLSRIVKVEVRRRDSDQAVALRRRAPRLPSFFHSEMERSASSSVRMSSMLVRLRSVMCLWRSMVLVMWKGDVLHQSRSLGYASQARLIRADLSSRPPRMAMRVQNSFWGVVEAPSAPAKILM